MSEIYENTRFVVFLVITFILFNRFRFCISFVFTLIVFLFCSFSFFCANYILINIKMFIVFSLYFNHILLLLLFCLLYCILIVLFWFSFNCHLSLF